MNFETVGEGTILYGQEKNNDLHDLGNLKRVDTKFQQLKLESCRS